MSLGRAVAWNTVVQVGGRAVGLVASIAFNAILVRHLGIATFGQFVAASTYVGVFMILGESGLYLVSVRRAMQEPERRASILGTALGLRLLWSIVPLTIAFVVAQLIPEERFPVYDRAVKLTIGILAFNEYLRLVCQFLTAVFRMHLRMELAVIGEVGSRVVALLGIVLIARQGGGLLSVALAFVCANGANLAYQWILSQRLERFRPQLDGALVREIIREAVVTAGVLILSLLRTQVGTLLLSLLAAAEALGIYGVATKVHEVMITFPAMFSAILFPVLSRLASEDEPRLRRLFQRTFDVMLLAGAGVSMTVFVLAHQFASILGEPRAAAPMRLLTLGLPAVFLAMTYAHLVLATAGQALLLRLYTLLTAVSLTINLLLIPRFSYWCVAATSVGIELIVLVVLAFYWWRVRGLRLSLRVGWCVPVAAALAAVLLTLGRRWLHAADADLGERLVVTALGGVSTLGVYFLVVQRLRLVDPDVLRALIPGRGANVAALSEDQG